MLRSLSTSSDTSRPPRGQTRDTLVRVAADLLEEGGLEAVTLREVGRRAGVSRAAPYRHFDSKDALLRAMYRRDAGSVARQLRAATDAASDPVSALEAWIDGYLGVFFDPRKAQRSAVMTSEGTRRAAGYHEEQERAEAELMAPLVDVLRDGMRAGVFCSTAPERDAATIYAVVTSTGTARRPGAGRFNLDAARAHVQRFCWPALGLAVELPNGDGHRRSGGSPATGRKR